MKKAYICLLNENQRCQVDEVRRAAFFILGHVVERSDYDTPSEWILDVCVLIFENFESRTVQMHFDKAEILYEPKTTKSFGNTAAQPSGRPVRASVPESDVQRGLVSSTLPSWSKKLTLIWWFRIVG